MPWAIVETKKKGKKYKDITAVPETWIIESNVYWPKNNLLTMLKDDTTQPNITDFLPQSCKVLEKNIPFLIEAENRVAHYQNISDSDGPSSKKMKPLNSTPKTHIGAYNLDESTAIAKPSSLPPQNLFDTISSINVTSDDLLNQNSSFILSYDETGQAIITQQSFSVKQNGVQILPFDNISHSSTSTPIQSKQMAQFVAPKEVQPMPTGVSHISKSNPSYIPTNELENMDPEDSSESNSNVDINDLQPPVQHVDINDFIFMMDSRMKRMEERIDRFAQVVPEVLGKMTKEITVIKCGIELLAKHQGPSKDSQSIQQAEIQSENFDDLEIVPELKTTEDVYEFENKLQNDEYMQRLTRYYKRKYGLAGDKDGAGFFNTFLRDLTNTGLFLRYSWKGNKRTAENLSFKEVHGTFVKFFTNIMIMADSKTSEAEVGQLFARYLRYKNVHHSRELERIATNKPTRESSSRTSKPRVKKKLTMSSTEQTLTRRETDNGTAQPKNAVQPTSSPSANAQQTVSNNAGQSTTSEEQPAIQLPKLPALNPE